VCVREREKHHAPNYTVLPIVHRARLLEAAGNSDHVCDFIPGKAVGQAVVAAPMEL